MGEESITTLVRLEKFLGNKEAIKGFKQAKYGISGLLGADTIDRTNYYLNGEINKTLFEQGTYKDEEIGMLFYCTDIRIENTNNLLETLEEKREDDYLVIFTHEWMLDDNKIREKIIEICNWANKNNDRFTAN